MTTDQLGQPCATSSPTWRRRVAPPPSDELWAGGRRRRRTALRGPSPWPPPAWWRSSPSWCFRGRPAGVGPAVAGRSDGTCAAHRPTPT